MGLISWVVVGAIAGALARRIVPGSDPGRVVVTVILGMAGASPGRVPRWRHRRIRHDELRRLVLAGGHAGRDRAALRLRYARPADRLRWERKGVKEDDRFPDESSAGHRRVSGGGSRGAGGGGGLPHDERGAARGPRHSGRVAPVPPRLEDVRRLHPPGRRGCPRPTAKTAWTARVDGGEVWGNTSGSARSRRRRSTSSPHSSMSASWSSAAAG